jgi:SAM-dependent methyltransferase
VNPLLDGLLQCPSCSGELVTHLQPPELACIACGRAFPLQDGIPLFSPPPAGLIPSEKLQRSPDSGTPWRKANWQFLQKQMADFGQEALILDVGAGRGDFAEALCDHRTLAIEIYPYPEVDLVCDLTQTNPFRPASFDAVLLLNVLEHVYDTQGLLANLSSLLKPGGRLLVAIPFMVKMHQTPVDFVRYSEFALQRLGEQHGLNVETLEGYYDPVFFLGEGIGNLRNAVLPNLSRTHRQAARLLLQGIQALAGGLARLLGPGQTLPAMASRNPAPTGYQIVYRKPE